MALEKRKEAFKISAVERAVNFDYEYWSDRFRFYKFSYLSPQDRHETPANKPMISF
jgi:hypothetical protein